MVKIGNMGSNNKERTKNDIIEILYKNSITMTLKGKSVPCAVHSNAFEDVANELMVLILNLEKKNGK